jgi:hypothetical protein
MLGLGVGFYRLGGEDTAASRFTPKGGGGAGGGVDRWYSANVGISGASGGSSNAGTMADGENITTWVDQSGNGVNAVQATAAHQPHWETDAADFGALKFDNVADMTFEAIEIDANEDFSVIIRIKPIAFGTDVIIGNDSSNFLRFNGSNADFRTKIGGAGNNNFNDSSNTVSTSVYSTLIFSRTNAETGTLNLYVKAEDVANEIDWAEGHGETDNDALTLSVIGAQASGTNEINAFIKDVLIYKGSALSRSERIDMYSYLESQVY